MSSRRTVALLIIPFVITGLLAGCGGKSKEKDKGGAASIADAENAAAGIRERYQRLNPKNRVGVVTAVMPSAKLAAVSDIPVQDFGIGDVVVFIDTDEKVIGNGEVRNATPNSLHVRYDATKREPRVGDLAVRVVTQ